MKYRIVPSFLRIVLLLTLCLGGLSACKSFTVESQHSTGVNYADYRSFAFSATSIAPPTGFVTGHLFNSIMQRRIQDEVTKALTARGYRLVSQAEASFEIKFSGGSKESVEGSGLVHEGALVLHFVDPVKNKIIWRGWATATMGPDDDLDAKVREAVREILKIYPPEGV